MKIFLKLKKKSKNEINEAYKDSTSQDAYFNSFFLDDHNRKILKRYNKPIVKDLPERKKIFIEVRDVLEDIEARLSNSEIDD